MDTSETYIKMETKAFGCTPVYDWGEDCDNVYPHLYIDTSGNFWMRYIDSELQLHRQDQLQEMIGATSLWNLNHRYSKWLYDIDDEGMCDFHIKHKHQFATSMEQLWLAFVMKEKFNKYWDGTNWVSNNLLRGEENNGKS